jgi:hypothetical protein
LPEAWELEEDVEVPESKKEPEGKVEDPEGKEKELELETEPEPSLPEPDEEERVQEFQLMMEKLNNTVSIALEGGQRRRGRR